MKKNYYLSSKGVTLIELLLSVTILVVILSMAMSAWVSFTQKTNRINEQASLDIEARRIIENFRSEMSKTSRDSIIFYPRNQSPYQAVSFALPADQDGDGLVEMNPATSHILWRQTIVYHIFNQSPDPTQMRRTQFLNRNQTATFDERYAQVESVVAAGNGSGACLLNETTSMKVMFENLFTGKLWQAEARFDGYAPVANTREWVNFGVAPIDPGPQQLTFTVVDKNPLSTGRKIGLDRISISASGFPMEAELVDNATSIPKVYAGVGLASAGYGLMTATTANGQQVSLTLNNDALEESLFIGDGRNVLFSNTVVRLDEAYMPSGFDSGVLCSKLDGQCFNSWSASEQALSTASIQVPFPTNIWVVFRIPILSDPVLNAAGEPNAYGVRKSGFNPVIRLLKSNNNGGILIKSASLVILPPGELPVNADGSVNNSAVGPIIGAAPQQIIPLQFWQNGIMTTWSNALPRTTAELSRLVELHSGANREISVQLGSTLMLQLEVKGVPSAATSHIFENFQMSRPGLSAGAWYSYCNSDAQAAALMQTPTWTSANPFYYIPFLRSLVVNYPDEGYYISHVFDTTETANKAKSMMWDAQMPSAGGGALRMYARSGNTISANGFDITDASSWASISPFANPPPTGGASVGTGRYVQFKTVFVSQRSILAPDAGALTSSTIGPYRNDTPRLRWVRFNWQGMKKYVEASAQLLQGPDCGIFTVKVNGQELVRGVTMEIEIFKDIRGVGGKPIRIRSGVSAEVDPRNSGK